MFKKIILINIFITVVLVSAPLKQAVGQIDSNFQRYSAFIGLGSGTKREEIIKIIGKPDVIDDSDANMMYWGYGDKKYTTFGYLTLAFDKNDKEGEGYSIIVRDLVKSKRSLSAVDFENSFIGKTCDELTNSLGNPDKNNWRSNIVYYLKNIENGKISLYFKCVNSTIVQLHLIFIQNL